ncbi:hypothetical protein Q1W71_11860 [Flavobacterium pectinovorum]|uniref:hypothetical protein n=1 Tax=Flavobacterium pectinovorum TaxID=29533 RepID=UPI00265FF3E3|nr:hypothetical protein [Flavobacterium pectinovorum]WKL50440.1 hypothetical protein Q1W71_11860 [Flavobacterium pectinovorum]
MKNRLIIKGTILTSQESFYVGGEIFSSILFSVVNSWFYSNYENDRTLKVNITEDKAREFGRIKSAMNGFTEDLHNLSINYCLFKEINETVHINGHKSNLYISIILENLFSNLRSIYDFLYHFIKIALSDKELKTYPATDSINKLITFSKNEKNQDKLPKNIIWILGNIEDDLNDIKQIRDNIIHKGKDFLLTRKEGVLYMRVPIKETNSNDNLLPNILKTNDIDYNVEKYLNKIIKTTLKNIEDFGVIISNEISNNPEIQFNLYSISNYCIDEFNEFLINKNSL